MPQANGTVVVYDTGVKNHPSSVPEPGARAQLLEENAPIHEIYGIR